MPYCNKAVRLSLTRISCSQLWKGSAIILRITPTIILGAFITSLLATRSWPALAELPDGWEDAYDKIAGE